MFFFLQGKLCLFLCAGDEMQTLQTSELAHGGFRSTQQNLSFGYLQRLELQLPNQEERNAGVYGLIPAIITPLSVHCGQTLRFVTADLVWCESH